jgi:hypothetical protein
MRASSEMRRRRAASQASPSFGFSGDVLHAAWAGGGLPARFGTLAALPVLLALPAAAGGGAACGAGRLSAGFGADVLAVDVPVAAGGGFAARRAGSAEVSGSPRRGPASAGGGIAVGLGAGGVLRVGAAGLEGSASGASAAFAGALLTRPAASGAASNPVYHMSAMMIAVITSSRTMTQTHDGMRFLRAWQPARPARPD